MFFLSLPCRCCCFVIVSIDCAAAGREQEKLRALTNSQTRRLSLALRFSLSPSFPHSPLRSSTSRNSQAHFQNRIYTPTAPPALQCVPFAFRPHLSLRQPCVPHLAVLTPLPPPQCRLSLPPFSVPLPVPASPPLALLPPSPASPPVAPTPPSLPSRPAAVRTLSSPPSLPPRLVAERTSTLDRTSKTRGRSRTPPARRRWTTRLSITR